MVAPQHCEQALNRRYGTVGARLIPASDLLFEVARSIAPNAFWIASRAVV
jgi:hypothetical protein